MSSMLDTCRILTYSCSAFLIAGLMAWNLFPDEQEIRHVVLTVSESEDNLVYITVM